MISFIMMTKKWKFDPLQNFHHLYLFKADDENRTRDASLGS